MNRNWGIFCKIALAGLALLFIATGVSAGWAFGYYNNDWSVEVFSGGHWSAYSEPYYAYHYGNYYYFDTPYRVYYSGNYYNYEPGWYYGGNRYWYRDTPVYYGQRYWYGESYGYYYSPYYAPNYYYWGGNWNYYPNWVGDYGYVYYGNAYYWPADRGYYSGAYSGGTAYYGPTYTVSYGGGYGSGRSVGYGEYTGYDYKYPQGAYCTEMALSADDFYITAGEKGYATVYVKNNSKKNFTIKNVSVYIGGFDVTETGKDYDSLVPSGSTREIKVRLEAIGTASSADISANVKVSGVFTDGTNCSLGDIRAAEFTIHVSGKAKDKPAEKSGDYEYAYSASSYEPKNAGDNSWKDVSVSTGEYSTGASQSKGSGTGTYTPKGNCYSLGFENRAGVSVDAGESAYAEIYLKNNSALNFYVDSVQVEEYATEFSASGYVKDSVVLKGERARTGFWTYANEAKADDTGTIYITANGHFSSGISCAIKSNAVQVYMKGGKNNKTNAAANFSAAGFGFNFPEQAEIDNSRGGIGYIELKIDNPFDSAAIITLAGEGVDVFPQTINIPRQTYAEKVVRISNLGRETGFVVYRVEVNGETIIEKYTRVVEGENGYWPAEEENENENNNGSGYGNGNQNSNAGSDNGSGSGNGDNGSGSGNQNSNAGSGAGSGNGTSFTGLAGTAFAVLNGNAVNIGLVVLILTMLWMVYRATSGRRVSMPKHKCEPKACGSGNTH
ncbi:MAG: hypothetical protein V1676_03250 [Candidatus Diapherotrites archaeon]